MIFRGRHAGYYLYELTYQDLKLKGEATEGYFAGNVLIYSGRGDIQLGSQIAQADDLASAREFLDHSGEIVFDYTQEVDKRSDSLEQQAQNLEKQVIRLSQDVRQRDDLLRDICDALSIQRDHNLYLTEQLRSAQEQLTTDELTREELLSDLQNVSQETQNIETTLEETLLEKDELEHELASAITNFLELNLQNDEMQRRLDELNTQYGADSTTKNKQTARESSVPLEKDASRIATSAATAAAPVAAAVVTTSAPDNAFAAAPDAQTIVMSSGKKIHLYHEFPLPSRSALSNQLSFRAQILLRALFLAIGAILLTVLVSLIATAQLNQTSPGEALDLLLKSLRLG